jgi:hypothetical protein
MRLAAKENGIFDAARRSDSIEENSVILTQEQK